MRIQFAKIWVNRTGQHTNVKCLKISAMLVVGLIGVCHGHGRRPGMTVYYVPLGIQTYIPVTMENIEARSFYKLNIRNQKTIKAIEAVMSDKTDGVLVKKMVRVKVIMLTSGKVLYVDSAGGVIAENDGEFRINAQNLENILMSYIKDNKIQRIEERGVRGTGTHLGD